MLENHAKEGLPAADLQVIRRGKALEYFSRHYGKVYVDEGRAISVKDALVGINQLIDEDADKGKEPPPVNAEPITRQFLRIFDGNASELKRDQLQKFLQGLDHHAGRVRAARLVRGEEQGLHAASIRSTSRATGQGKHRRRLTSRSGSGAGPDRRLLRRQRHQCLGHAEERELQAARRAEAAARMAAPQRPGPDDPQRGVARGVDLQRLGAPAQAVRSQQMAPCSRRMSV